MDIYKQDAVTAINPKHYRSHPSGVECIDVIRHLPVSQGMIIKYLWRAGDKGPLLEDLQKALWYVEDCLKHNCGISYVESTGFNKDYKNYSNMIDLWWEAEPAGYRKKAIEATLLNRIGVTKDVVCEWIESINAPILNEAKE